MKRILFVCLGNICRSPMAEFVLQHKVKERNVAHEFYIESAATSRYEIGSDTHHGTKQELFSHNIACPPRQARQITRSDYDHFDYIIYMDDSNHKDLLNILGQDASHKLHKMMHFAGSNADVADPWYTGNFSQTYKDIDLACNALLAELGY